MGKPILEKKVYQANPLIEARKQMSVQEMRLFVLGLQDLKPRIKDGIVYDVDFHETWVTPSELKELFGNTAGVSRLKKSITEAFRGYIELSYEDGGFGLRHIYRKMEYIKEKGLQIQFDDEIKPYLLELMGKPFTSYPIKAVFSLTSEYAWRIMELLLENQGHFKQGKTKVYRTLTMDEIRFKLNVPADKYIGRINNFRSRVLDIPMSEINDKTMYHVWYDIKKEGRTVSGFTLWMERKDKSKFSEEDVITIDVDERPAAHLSETPPTEEDKKAILKDQMLNNEGFTLVQFNSVLKKWGLETVTKNFALGVAEADAKHLHGKERKQYIKTYVENDFAYDRKLAEKIKKHEKEQIAESKRHGKELSEAFGSRWDAFTEKPVQKNTRMKLTEELLENLLSIVAYSIRTNSLSQQVINNIKAYGFKDENDFIKKYKAKLSQY